jgi:hypothetical protein
MEYITVQDAARQWGISERRVRLLCAQGRIEGAHMHKRSYRIPATAEKPSDGRRAIREIEERALGWLKWDDTVIATIKSDNTVTFTLPDFNEVVALYTQGRTHWDGQQYLQFLSERLVSRDRRDIERILFRLGLSQYDVLAIANHTRAIHPKDLLWIAHTPHERLKDVTTEAFHSIFVQHTDLVGERVDSPEGYNIKRYGVWQGAYGIYKQRLHPLSYDTEAEVAAYLLSKRLGVRLCPAYRTDKDTVFSTFLYDFTREYIVHFRRLFDGPRSENEYRNLVAVRPQFKDEIAAMILFDCITRQDDRHLSNIAIVVGEQGESFYPLYDNGRSLFYEDTEEMVANALADPILYASTFGSSGTYWDYATEIAREYGDLGRLINLEVGRAEVYAILVEAGFSDYRLEGATTWIVTMMGMLAAL